MADLAIPPVIFGTSGLGNLFVALDEPTKFSIVKACLHHSSGTPVFDTAGKYGAGLALELLGRCLHQLGVKQEDVIICNKLGWFRTELLTDEPTFEPGAWKDLKHDAVQKISYDGILECYEQGNELLQHYHPQLVSVHDPDEYLATAGSEAEEAQLYSQILDAYAALFSLKQKGKVRAVGVGAKNWKVIQRIAADVELDWVMIANSLTIKSHPPELLAFVRQLEAKGVVVFNSAVFHSGFLVGSNNFDYRKVERGTPEADALFDWRDRFFSVCAEFGVKPAEACVQFARSVPGVSSIALSTTDADRVSKNVALIHAAIPAAFWERLRSEGLIDINVVS